MHERQLLSKLLDALGSIFHTFVVSDDCLRGLDHKSHEACDGACNGKRVHGSVAPGQRRRQEPFITYM